MYDQYVIKVRTVDDVLQLAPVFGAEQCERQLRFLSTEKPMWIRANMEKIFSTRRSRRGDFEECPYFNGEIVDYCDLVAREFKSPAEFLQFAGISDCDAVSNAVIDDIF